MLATELPDKIRQQLRLPEGATRGWAIAMGIALSASIRAAFGDLPPAFPSKTDGSGVFLSRQK